MKNINPVKTFQSTIKPSQFGTLTTLNTEIELSAKSSITFNEKTLITNYIYKKDGTYNLIYTIVDNEGNEESFTEDDGILPTLFLSPEQKNYVSIVPYNPDKELEISIPVFNRETIEIPKGNKPVNGDFIGTTNQYSIFYDVDIWSGSKPDKLYAFEFKNGDLKKKHTIKVPLPRNNKIFIANNEIHLLTVEKSVWIHRQIDEKGNVLRERQLKPKAKHFQQILYLSFEENSAILYQQKGILFLEQIDKNGNCTLKPLRDFKDSFYNTWKPEKIGENTYITRFNSEFGNGWLTIRNDVLLEPCYSKGVNGYRNLLTDEVLEMQHGNPVISSLNKTKENCYAVIFYRMTERGSKNSKLLILNREIE